MAARLFFIVIEEWCVVRNVMFVDVAFSFVISMFTGSNFLGAGFSSCTKVCFFIVNHLYSRRSVSLNSIVISGWARWIWYSM